MQLRDPALPVFRSRTTKMSRSYLQNRQQSRNVVQWLAELENIHSAVHCGGPGLADGMTGRAVSVGIEDTCLTSLSGSAFFWSPFVEQLIISVASTLQTGCIVCWCDSTLGGAVFSESLLFPLRFTDQKVYNTLCHFMHFNTCRSVIFGRLLQGCGQIFGRKSQVYWDQFIITM